MGTDPLAGTDLIGLGAVWHSILQDDQTWKDRNGLRWNVDQMTTEHREHVRRYLRRHAARLEHVTSLYLLSRGLGADDPDGMLTQTPIEWLYATPLFGALVRAG